MKSQHAVRKFTPSYGRKFNGNKIFVIRYVCCDRTLYTATLREGLNRQPQVTVTSLTDIMQQSLDKVNDTEQKESSRYIHYNHAPCSSQTVSRFVHKVMHLHLQ